MQATRAWLWARQYCPRTQLVPVCSPAICQRQTARGAQKRSACVAKALELVFMRFLVALSALVVMSEVRTSLFQQNNQKKRSGCSIEDMACTPCSDGDGEELQLGLMDDMKYVSGSIRDKVFRRLYNYKHVKPGTSVVPMRQSMSVLHKRSGYGDAFEYLITTRCYCTSDAIINGKMECGYMQPEGHKGDCIYCQVPGSCGSIKIGAQGHRSVCLHRPLSALFS